MTAIRNALAWRRAALGVVALGAAALLAACVDVSVNEGEDAGGGDSAFACDSSLPDAALVIVFEPAGGATVSNGFGVSGCSRTHESNVVWRLLDRSGAVLAEGFTSGGGFDGPGEFSFSVEYEGTERQLAHLEVFDVDESGGEGFPPPRDVVPLWLEPAP